jgi:hypothetical protein
MNLSALASQYVAYKQAMGMRFHSEARTLRSFCLRWTPSIGQNFVRF